VRGGRLGAGCVADDPLLRSQLRAADVVALSKPDLADVSGRTKVLEAVKAVRPGAVVVEALHGAVPAALLFSRTRIVCPRCVSRAATSGGRAVRDAELTSDRPVSLASSKAAIERWHAIARRKGCSRR